MASMTVEFTDIESQNRPSFYATPLAWATLAFTRVLVAEERDFTPHLTGLIVASDECSLGTIRELSRTAAQGTISPLKFAGSSPSIVVGLPAMQLGIRGPTLCLTMRPDSASDAILAMIDYWIRYNRIDAVIVIAHHNQGGRCHRFKGFVARSADDASGRLVLQICKP